jgi:hypothetical protein
VASNDITSVGDDRHAGPLHRQRHGLIPFPGLHPRQQPGGQNSGLTIALACTMPQDAFSTSQLFSIYRHRSGSQVGSRVVVYIRIGFIEKLADSIGDEDTFHNWFTFDQLFAYS